MSWPELGGWCEWLVFSIRCSMVGAMMEDSDQIQTLPPR